MKHNSLTVSIIALILVSFTVPGHAFEAETEESPWIYDTLSQYDFFVVPAVAGGAGAIVGGTTVAGPIGFITGAALGTLLGTLDEILIAYEYTDSYALTSGVMGAGTLSTLEIPYHLNTITGFILGVLINAGMLEGVQEHAGSIIQGAISGQVYMGTATGALIGTSASIADEMLSSWEISDGNNLSLLMASLAEAKVLSSLATMLTFAPIVGPHIGSPSVNKLGCIIFAIKAFWNNASSQPEKDDSEDGQTPDSPVEVLSSLKSTLSRVMDPETLNKILNKQAIVLIGTQILTSRMSQASASYSQSFNTRLAQFKNSNAETLPSFYKALGQFTLLLFPLIAHEITSSVITDHYSRIFSEAAQEELKEKYFSEGNLLKLSRDPDTEVLTDRMDYYIIETTGKGSKLLASAVKSYVGGGYSACLLYSYNALDLGQLIQTYIERVHSITISLNEKQLHYENAVEELRSKLVSFQKEINRNAKLIASGDKEDLLLQKQIELIEELRVLKRNQSIQQLLVTTWVSFEMLLESIIEFGFVALKMHKGEVPFNKYMATIDASNTLASSYSWYSKNAAEITAYNKAMLAINELLEKMEQEGDPRIAEKNTATYHYISGDKNGLLCKNFWVGHEDAVLVENQTFELEPKVYAVSGNSGSGKSSFLSKIKGTLYNGIWAQGEITYTTKSGEKPRIHQASQEDYILPYSTLLEVITIKHREELAQQPEIKQRVIELLREIGIDDKEDNGLIAMLDEERDWRAILSGGQKKKIAIVTTILKEPDIAILDEVFNGLDSNSVRQVQAMLRRELPDSIFLIVDHNYEEHNHGFFDARLHLGDKKVEILKR